MSLELILADQGFCDWFASHGGGFHPLAPGGLDTEERRIANWLMSNAEYLAYPHRFAMTGQRMPADDIAAQLRIRNGLIDKLLEWHQRYQAKPAAPAPAPAPEKSIEDEQMALF